MKQASEPLPQVIDKEPLSYFWFPTPAQCFLYRTWEMITPERLAKILNVASETVIQMAQELGLSDPATLQQQEKWISVGYATLIRANWHLLPFSHRREQTPKVLAFWYLLSLCQDSRRVGKLYIHLL